MIKKLRWKFMISNMFFVVTILITILGLFFYSGSKRFVRQTEMALAFSIDKDQRPPSFHLELENKRKKDPPPPIPTFVVTLNSDHTVKSVEVNNITVTKELASSLVKLIDSKGLTKGVLSDYSLRYVKIDSPKGTKIGFADQTYELNNIKTFMVNCFLMFLVAVVLFFLLSLYLSRLALKPVEKAWQQQNQFIADASHELKTPLTVILANLDILTSHEECTIQDQKKWFNNTKEEVLRMKQLVENLLFLARSDAGAGKDLIPLNSLVDFSHLVLKSTLIFESVAFEHKVALANNIENDIIINGCESQLKQVVSILLDNACKYAEKNSTISIELKKSSHFAILTICNHGEVISPEELIHIFERFYRTDKSRVRKEGGYGLGLSIAKTILEHHKGKIQVASSQSEGTIFTVTLPLQA